MIWIVEKLEKLVTTLHAFIVCEQPKRILSDITTSEIRISKTQRVVSANKEDTPFHGRSELDSHSDTTMAGKNSIILHYTDCSCDQATISDKYTPMKDVPIVSADTGYMSANSRNYILVFNEVLYIKDMQHTPINPTNADTLGQRYKTTPTMRTNQRLLEAQTLNSLHDSNRKVPLSFSTHGTLPRKIWRPTHTPI